MSNPVKVIECPRDAWQGLSKQIPTELKAEYLGALIEAGFTRLDAVSFVSPRAVPQMAHSEEVLKILNPPTGVEIIGVVMNRMGARRGIATRRVSTLGFPYSVSPTFAHRNQRHTLEASWKELRVIKRFADRTCVNVVAYVSMAFGNPYGDPWDTEIVLDAVARIESAGIKVISLADTVGLATSGQVDKLMRKVCSNFPGLEIGVHLHSRPDQAEEKVLAAYEAGCRRFDSAIGGLGGCPFAQDERVGNIPTEALLHALSRRGVYLRLHGIDRLIAKSAEIAARYA